MKKQKTAWPNEDTVKRIGAKLEKSPGSFLLPSNASAVDRAKYETCKQILLFMQKKKLTQRQLAKMLEVPETRVSEIVHYRIWKFTLDRLLCYLEKLNPKIAVKVA